MRPMSTRRSLVTGAGRGLGLELVRQLLERGDRVIAAVRVPETAEALQALSSRHAGSLNVLKLDVADEKSIAPFAQSVARHTDAIDLLINNAGINSSGVTETQRNVRFGQLESDGILAMVRVNALGPLL